MRRAGWLAGLVLVAGIGLAGPALARDALGVFDTWAAFRDPGVPRCYAIAVAEPSTLKRDGQPYVTVALWPRRGVRGQVYFRLSRRLADHSPAHLAISGDHFDLVAGKADAWAADPRTDAAIVAAMRSAPAMVITARAADGRLVRDRYVLGGAASAIDAAALGCAKQ